MADILIVGEENSFLIQHLTFWLKDKDCVFVVSNDLSKHRGSKFNTVVFMEEVKRSTVSESVPINEALFDFQFSLLQQSLLLNYESFIYIDSSYQTDFINNIYKMYITMGRDMVAQICKLLNKKYKIIFLYDIVGYKFPNFTLWETNLQRIMEINFPSMPKLLQHHFHYQNKHYVYVADAIRAIIKIIESTIFHNNNIENIEEHIRYDDNGLDVTKVLSLFERSNNVKFLKTDITYDNKKAPLSGKPSWFLKDFKTNNKLWFKVRKIADY